MRTLSLAETKARLSEVVDQVLAGEEVVITRRGLPVARIVAEPAHTAPALDALLDELRENVLAQPCQQHSAVTLVRMLRDEARY